MGNKKKALAVVAGPYRFYQVLWLYTQFQEYEWSILILPYGEGDKNAKEIQKHCETLGIFKNIYHSHMTGQNSSKWEQLAILTKMFGYYIVGQKKGLMRKIIREQTGGLEFEVAFVGCEYSIIEGAIIGLADEIEVNIFEEGLGDYVPKKKYPGLNFKEIVSYVICKMGYFSPYEYFELKYAKYCIKYATFPEKIKNRHFKAIRQLYKKGYELDTKREEYDLLCHRVFNYDTEIIQEADVIFFTLPLKGYVKNVKEEEEKLHYWFVQNYRGKKIVIKKHPRDEYLYKWNDVKVEFLDATIPSEVIVNQIEEQDVVIIGMSTTILSFVGKEKDIIILKHENVYDIFNEGMWKTEDIFVSDRTRIIKI